MYNTSTQVWTTRELLPIRLLLLLAGLWLIASSAFAQKPTQNDRINVAFINPDKAGNPFWDKVTLYMQYAAEDLDINLDVHYAESRYYVPTIAEKVVSSNRKPDYLVFIYQYAQSLEVLEITEKAKVKAFIINTNMVKNEKPSFGAIREKYKYWIGHSYPDNPKSGQQLAHKLIQVAREKGIQHEHQDYILALHGTRDSSVSTDYRFGLENAISTTPNVKIVQQLYSNWNSERARKQSEGILRRHPEVNIIWTGNQGMAIGAIEAAEKQGRKPGQDIVIGGTITGIEGIVAVEQGKLIANIGGDTLEGAWSLTQIFDYHQGLDFHTGRAINYSMAIVDQSNIAEYKKFNNPQFWKKLDFKQFTRHYNKELKRPTTPESIFNSVLEK